MNTKTAKKIRRLAKEQGNYKEGADYDVIETKKMMYATGKDGKPMAYEVKRQTLINKNRTVYRQMKKDYENGDLAI